MELQWDIQLYSLWWSKYVKGWVLDMGYVCGYSKDLYMAIFMGNSM